MNMIKSMTPWILAISFMWIVVSCTTQPDERASFEVPVVDYPISKFANFQTFRAELVTKQTDSYLEKSSGKTNYFFVILLKKTNGEQFTVSENRSEEHMVQVINSLEKDRSYTFPD